MKWDGIEIGKVVRHKLTHEDVIIVEHRPETAEPNIKIRRKNWEKIYVYKEELEKKTKNG